MNIRHVENVRDCDMRIYVNLLIFCKHLKEVKSQTIRIISSLKLEIKCLLSTNSYKEI